MRYALTEKQCRAAESTSEILLADGAGLYMRVRPAGKVWLIIRMKEGKRTKQSLGPYPEIGLAQARKLAEAPIGKLRGQSEPNSGESVTVEELLVRWHTSLVRADKDQLKRTIEIYAAALLPLHLAEIRRSPIVTVLEQARATGKARTTGVLFTALKSLFHYGVEHDFTHRNPMEILEKSKYGTSGARRRRVLSAAEIPVWLHKIRTHLPKAYQHILLLMLSSATRIGETCLAQIEHVNIEARTWFIPAENNKPKRDFTLSLSDYAVGIMREAIGERKTGPIFPSRHGSGPISEHTIITLLRDCQIGGEGRYKRTKATKALELPGGKWTSHDIRRTAATIMRAAGVTRETVEACLNHVETDSMVATYHQHDTTAATKESWRLLGGHLETFDLDCVLIKDDDA